MISSILVCTRLCTQIKNLAHNSNQNSKAIRIQIRTLEDMTGKDIFQQMKSSKFQKNESVRKSRLQEINLDFLQIFNQKIKAKKQMASPNEWNFEKKIITFNKLTKMVAINLSIKMNLLFKKV